VHAGADHLDRDQFDWLVRPGAVAVGALVLGAERLPAPSSLAILLAGFPKTLLR
jgi:hypothetical protein